MAVKKSPQTQRQIRINALVKKILEQNKKFAANNKPSEPVSPRKQAIFDAFYKGDFGCQREAVRQLTEVLTGFKIPDQQNSKIRPEFLVCYNLLPKTESQQLIVEWGKKFDNPPPKKKTRLIIELYPSPYQKVLFFNNGSPCLEPFNLTLSDMELCTEKEIREFLDKLTDAHLNDLFHQFFLALNI